MFGGDGYEGNVNLTFVSPISWASYVLAQCSCINYSNVRAMPVGIQKRILVRWGDPSAAGYGSFSTSVTSSSTYNSLNMKPHTVPLGTAVYLAIQASLPL